MAVQTLAKDQAKREKKNQKDLDEQFKKDDENAEKDAGRYMDLMDRIYKKDEIPRYENLEKTLKKFGVEAYGAKKGGLMKKCGIQLKGTSPLLKRKGKK